MIVLLHSGGLDSHVAWLMHPDWTPVYVRHGAVNEFSELRALNDLAALDPRFQPQVISTVTCRSEFDGHIAFRNALLLTTALAAFPDAEGIAYGALLGEGSGDKSRAFAKALAAAWSIGEARPVALLRPLSRYTKATALRHGMGLPGGHALMATTTCYHGTNCGRCQACFRMGIARYLCGIDQLPPALPTETKGVRATLAANPVRRWPALALANLDVVRAYGLHRMRRNRWR